MSDESANKPSMGDQRRLIDAAWQQMEHVRSSQAATVSGSRARLVDDWQRSQTAVPPDSLPGYRIIGEIHRGGQGVVYQGVQESTGRTVAIKVMRDGPFAGPKEKIRFEREVQILAQLRHPNIVTIHDSGTAGTAAFFVMDYIEGDPLDAYARRYAPDLRERLRLFAAICEAVNVAHLRGVIHRDLKPGNIRVDAAGEPHILDFGLAKQSDWGGGDAPEAMTITGQFVGSLPWASPEQAEGRQQEVDLRTDVYSLGVMLYHLLTGQFPYDVSGSLTQTAHQIVHTEPQNPRSLNKLLDDEIGTIVLKTLRKERDLRYQTAGGLGLDIRRYMAGEPIEAKRDSVSYVLRKQLSRHKAAVSIGFVFLAMLVAGFGISLSFWRQAVIARDAESGQRSLAQQRATQAATEAAKAQAVSDFLIDMLAAASPEAGGTPDYTVRAAVDTAARRMDQGELSQQPQIEAAVRQVIGSTYGSLGLYDEATHQLGVALALHEQTLPTDNEDVLNCRCELAGLRRAKGQLDEAEALFQSTLDTARACPEDRRGTIARCLHGLASVARDRDQGDEAIRLSGESLALFREMPGDHDKDIAMELNDLAIALEDSGDLDAALAAREEALALFHKSLGTNHHSTGIALSNLAGTQARRGDFAEAEELYTEALEVFRATVGEKHPSVASTLGAFGLLHLKRGDFKKAEPLLRESLAMRRELLGDEHPLVATGMNNLAIAQYQAGDLEAAAATYHETLALFKRTRGADHPSVATIMNNLAAVLRVKGDLTGSIAILREALAIHLTHLDDTHPLVATARHNLGKTLMETGELEESETLLRAALATRRAVYEVDHPEIATTVDALAGVLRQRGKLDEAEALCREGLENRRRKLGDDHQSVADSLNNLAGILMDRGQLEQAESLFADALRIAEAELPAGHWHIASIRANWGEALFKLGRLDQAETELLASHQALTAARGATHPHTRRAAATLADLYESLGRPQDAATWRARSNTSE